MTQRVISIVKKMLLTFGRKRKNEKLLSWIIKINREGGKKGDKNGIKKFVVIYEFPWKRSGI